MTTMDEEDALDIIEYNARTRCRVCGRWFFLRDAERVPLGSLKMGPEEVALLKTVGPTVLALICKGCKKAIDERDERTREALR